MKKEFFVQDKSGRNYTGTFSLEDAKGLFAHEDDIDWNTGETFTEWADESEIGATWENATWKTTRIQ